MKKIKIPVFIDDTWFCCFLNKKGKTTKSSNTGHLTEKGCSDCCQGYNKNIGYSKKEVAEIINKIKNGKKGQEKGKKEKTVISTKNQNSRNKVKSRE